MNHPRAVRSRIKDKGQRSVKPGNANPLRFSCQQPHRGCDLRTKWVVLFPPRYSDYSFYTSRIILPRCREPGQGAAREALHLHGNVPGLSFCALQSPAQSSSAPACPRAVPLNLPAQGYRGLGAGEEQGTVQQGLPAPLIHLVAPLSLQKIRGEVPQGVLCWRTGVC